MTITEFLLARIAEDEAEAVRVHDIECSIHRGFADDRGDCDCHDPARVLAECEAKRRIVEMHQSWPVLVEQPPVFEPIDADPSSLAMRASQQLAWLTDQEYRDRFGTEPPTAPMIAALAAVYADHPDYHEAWRP